MFTNAPLSDDREPTYDEQMKARAVSFSENSGECAWVEIAREMDAAGECDLATWTNIHLAYE